MIDNFKLKCFNERITRQLTPDFLNGKYAVKIIGDNDYKFKLYNSKNLTSSYLTIVCQHINSAGKPKHFSIDGSIRKWWFGDKSLKDLSIMDYADAINSVFEILEIPQKDRKYFVISRIEIGMNVFVKLPCYEILNRIIGYKSISYSRNAYKTGIVYKSATKIGIKMYDKIEEISKDFKNKRIKSFDEAQFLKENKEKNALRIEFTPKEPAKIKKELGFNDLENSTVHFDKFYSYFWEQLQHIQYDNAYNLTSDIDFSDIGGKEFDDLLLICGVIHLGIERIDIALKQPHFKYRRAKVKKLRKKYPVEDCPYNRLSFLKDVKIEMLYSMQKSGCLHLVKEGLLKNKLF